MGKFLHKYEKEADFQAVYNGEGYLEPWVSLTLEGKVMSFEAYCQNATLSFGGTYVGESSAYGGTYLWINPENNHDYYTKKRDPEVGDYVVFGSDWESWDYYVEHFGDTITAITGYDSRVDYNKQSGAITVEVYDEQGELANVTEYDDIDVPFEELMEPVFEAHGQRNFIRVVFSNGTEAFAGGDACGDLTKADIDEEYPEYSGTPAVPYDFDEEKFDEGMRGKTMRIHVSGTFC